MSYIIECSPQYLLFFIYFQLQAIIILEIQSRYVKWYKHRSQEYKWFGAYRQLTTPDKQKLWNILPISSPLILDNLPEPKLSTELQQTIKDIKYKIITKHQADYAIWNVESKYM